LIDGKSELNAFLCQTRELALAQAASVTSRIMQGESLPLAGVVLAVKDNIALKGCQLSCASRILEGYDSLFTSTALQRLIDGGVVIVGKTNLDEFAMGSSTEFSAHGTTRNPLDLERVPGGSSGGSAAAVAGGLCTAALGSETGGSTRQPAAFCGITGLKPTYGRISRYGLVAFGSSLDQIGAMARTAEETARVFEVMAGHDTRDNTTSPLAVPDCSGNLKASLTGLRVGIPVEYEGEGVQPEIIAAVERCGEVLKGLGATVAHCSLPHTKYAIPVYYILAPAEASSNLARYDGVRYGRRDVDIDVDADEDIIKLSRQSGFGAEVKRRIMLGTYVLSSGYYEAYYLKAQKVRRLMREDFVRVFRDFDVLLTPTPPTTAFKVGEKVSDPLTMYLSDIFTTPANLAGIPAISTPFGVDDGGLPIGIQLMAGHFREDLLLRVAHQLEITR
jgi:aspartyl-tRNA(Asn)/glutamyl-tRNA(Gln) amidotransferase subunit A